MEGTFKKFLGIAVFAAVSTLGAANKYATQFVIKPQGNGVIDNVIGGWTDLTHKSDAGECYGTFKVTPFVEMNFSKDKTAANIFFNEKDTMTFKGSSVGSTQDVLAEHFLLPSSHNGQVTAKPKMLSAGANIDFFCSLGQWVEGLYIKAQIPIVYSKWDLALVESPTTPGITMSAGFVSLSQSAETAPYTKIIDAWKGDKTVGLAPALTYGTVDGPQSKTYVANPSLQLGYDFIRKDNAHLGIFAYGALPGKKTECTYFFEPMVGAPQALIGGGISGHACLWESKDGEQALNVSLNGKVCHGLKRTMKRSYDLTANGKGSRYLLANQHVTSNNDLTDDVERVINLSTLDSKVKVNVIWDGALAFGYKNGGFDIDLGYNIWGRTKETNQITGTFTTVDGKYFSLWGSTVATNADDSSAAAISAGTGASGCAPKITIGGTNNAAGDVKASADNKITVTSLDVASGQADSALTHTVFGNMGYTWLDSEWTPYIGIGGKCAFAQDNSAANQWGVWTNIGIGF